jgi:hypothetical protein
MRSRGPQKESAWICAMAAPEPGEERRVERRKRYRWTNVVVLVVSVYLLASSVWSTPELMQDAPDGGVLSPEWLVMAYVLGGLAGLVGIAVSLKSAGIGRLLTALGGLVSLSGLLAMREMTPTALLSLGGAGVALLVAAAFMGPMPTPEQEGKPR